MTGKELVAATFRHEDTGRVPWVPFVGVHAGRLSGHTAREVYTSVDTLTAALSNADRVYHADGLPVMFDLQLEAEVLGCELMWSDDTPPTVTTHPLELNPDTELNLPDADAGRLPIAFEATRRLSRTIGQKTALYGLFCGPFTLASHLRGTNIFMDMFDDPSSVHRLLEFATAVGCRMADLYAEAGVDVLASVDPLVSQISPDHFTEFLHGPYSELFGHIRNGGTPSSLFVCGDATKNIEVMCNTAPDGISVDENIDLPQAKKITDRHDIVIAGNIPLASVMLFGTQQDNMLATIALLDSVDDKRNLIVSPGCDMPYAVPPENTIGCEQAVHHTEQARTVIANYHASDRSIHIDLPDYRALTRPLVEVFTIDSDTCAACGYMAQSALGAKEIFGDEIDVVEYKAVSEENIARMEQLGVTHLPAIFINGELRFSSIIPTRDELAKEIMAARR